MDGPLLKATPTGSGAQVPVPSDPVTTRVAVAGGSGCGPFLPVTETSWASHCSLLNSASTGPGTLVPGLHLPLFTGLHVAAHAQWGTNAGQELAVKWPQAAVVQAVHTLNLSDLEAPAAVSGALAPVPHSPAGTGTEVAPLSGVGLLDSGTVRVPAGAAFHASPVGPQPTAGGALRRGGGQRGQRLRVSFSDMPHHILQSEEFCLGGSPRCRTFDKNTSAGGLP